MNTTTTYWYLKPLDDNTNEQIASLLNSHGVSSDESEVTSITVGGNEIRGVYLVEYWVVRQLERSNRHHGKIRVYRRIGNGNILPWLFLDSNRKRIARTKKVQRVKKQLERLRPKK